MCGVIYLNDQKIEIYCVQPVPFWWRDPDPLDIVQVRLGNEQPGLPDPWKGELTKLGGMLAAAGHLRDGKQADRLGAVVAEVANNIAEQAEANVRFEWNAHAS